MDGHRHSVAGADGVRIGLLTEGSGPALLLVHGAMGSIERWEPVWLALTAGRRVTAMDRRGRRSSGDSELYTLTSEYGDVMAVASALASEQGAPVDVLGHSFGGTCVLGAAALGAPFRRIVLYEPPGPQTASPQWLEQLSAWIAAREVGPGHLPLPDRHHRPDGRSGRGTRPRARRPGCPSHRRRDAPA
jgi:pimeloyl-ACP methyl ester carboxylesterase